MLLRGSNYNIVYCKHIFSEALISAPPSVLSSISAVSYHKHSKSCLGALLQTTGWGTAGSNMWDWQETRHSVWHRERHQLQCCRHCTAIK